MKILKTVSLCIISLFCTLAAHAQFVGEAVETEKLQNYEQTPIVFSFAAVAEKLGVTATELDEAMSAWYQNPSAHEGFYVLRTANNSTVYNTNLPGGYWMASDGSQLNWGAGATWYEDFYWTMEGDSLAFNVGQYPGAVVYGDENPHCIIAISMNEDTVTFDLTLKIVDDGVKDATDSSSKLQILKTVEYTVTEEPRSDYSFNNVSVDVKGIIESLALDSAWADNNPASIFYNTTQNYDGLKADELTNTSTATPHGWWEQPLYDEATGDYLQETTSATYNMSTCKFFIQTLDLDAENETVNFGIGQMPNVCYDGDKYYTYVYVIYGDKAWEIKVNLNIDSSIELPFEQKENKGLYSISIDQYPTSDYYHTYFDVPIDSLADVMGVPVSEIKLWAESEPGVPSYNHTADQGYWLDTLALITPWTSTKDMCGIAIEPNSMQDLTNMHICQYPNTFEAGDTITAHLYLMANKCYMDFYVTLNVIEDTRLPIKDYEIVATKNCTMDIIPSSNYQDDYMNQAIDLNLDEIIELLGPSFTFYGEKLNDDNEVVLTNTYNAESSGFWLTDNYVVDWNPSTSSFSIQYLNGYFNFWQIPNLREEGDMYTANFYLVSETEEKMIKYVVNVEYVSSLEGFETVGDTTLYLPYMSEDDDYVETDIEIAPILEALGCEEEEFYNMSEWKTLTSKGTYSARGWDDMYGFCYDAEGELVESDEDFVMSCGFISADESDCGMDCFRSYAGLKDGPYTLKQIVRFNGKQYVFNIVICENPEEAMGVKSIESSKNASVVAHYNTAGQKISKSQKGVNILKLSNGKTVKVYNK